MHDAHELTTAQAAERAGVTERQLKYWAAIGILSSSGEYTYWWGEMDVRRASVIGQVAATQNGVSDTGWRRKLAPLKAVPDTALRLRYLLFSPKLKLLAATNDAREAIRIATAASGGVLLAELPAYAAAERAEAAHG
jgi:hypothetical protein